MIVAAREARAKAESGTRMDRVVLSAPGEGAAYAVHPRPVTVGHRRRRGRFFTLGGGSADGVEGSRCSRTRVPCASSRLFMFGGLLRIRSEGAKADHARSPRSRIGSNRDPTALQRSDASSVRAPEFGRIDFWELQRLQGVSSEKGAIEGVYIPAFSANAHVAAPPSRHSGRAKRGPESRPVWTDLDSGTGLRPARNDG